jgi:hypothetical protein
MLISCSWFFIKSQAVIPLMIIPADAVIMIMKDLISAGCVNLTMLSQIMNTTAAIRKSVLKSATRIVDRRKPYVNFIVGFLCDRATATHENTRTRTSLKLCPHQQPAPLNLT